MMLLSNTVASGVASTTAKRAVQMLMPMRTGAVILTQNGSVGSKSASANNSSEVKDSDSFCMNMFRGQQALSQVFPYPLKLSDDQREMLQMVIAPTTKFLEEVNKPMENDEKAMIPMETLAKMGELGAFGAVVPEQYGGAGMNNTQMARLAELVGSSDLGLGVVMGAHQSIGYKGILLYGTDAQKQKYLPDVATGRKFAAFCLTEPSSGSDANSIQARAVKSDCGRFYILNGGKVFISNGGFAEVFTVFAQTPVKQSDGSVKDKVSAFIVERGFGGLTNGPPEKKMGIKGSNTAALFFDNVKIPVENLLGQEGEGFKVAMNILNNGRFGIPAAMTGAMKFCIKKTIDHVNQRVQFGSKLRTFGNVREKLADMLARHYASESLVYMLAANMDAGVQEYQLEAAIGKVFTSECAWNVCDEAIQLYGGMGFMRETELERVQRDLRIFRIFEGANDVMRLFVSLTGMQYAGKHLQQVQRKAKGGNVGALIGEICRRYGNKKDKVSGHVCSELREPAGQLNTAMQAFGSTTDKLLRTYGSKIIDRQYELIRVANAAINCYAMACTLARCQYAVDRMGSKEAAHDLQLARFFVRRASQSALAELRVAAAGPGPELALINDLSESVCDQQAIIQRHPVDV